MKASFISKSILVLLLSVSLLLAGCGTQSIREVKSEDYVGKEVAVAGSVGTTIKIGSLSGFTLTDKNGDTIGVKSDALPKEGSKMTVRGVLIKDTIFGYYIQSKE
jgi:ATP-dependent Lon protease